MVKKIFLFVLLALLPVAAFGQARISARLMDALRTAKAQEYVRGLVVLNDQADVAALDAYLYEVNAPLKERARQVMTLLQEKADQTQPGVAQYLEQKYAERKVFIYKPFWIVNMFVIEALPSVYFELVNNPAVGTMDLDAQTFLDEPIKNEALGDPNKSVQLGVDLIKAPELWKLGITGLGSIVMSEDVGVHHPHEAIAPRWRGNHVPPEQAWFDPYGGTTTPSGCPGSSAPGHGTHTVGTMLGIKPNGDTLGVAPDAEWIAAKTICSGNSTSNHFAAFQWAMNPDGDVNTIDDMPDAINCSWYDPGQAGIECDGPYVQLFQAAEAAGIAVVFSAGNNGSGTSTVTPPKNINYELTSVFSVGAIDGALYHGGNFNPIASFSSRGPSLCGGDGSLLIKPEVSAPGVNVYSCDLGNTAYTTMSGTSMAAPHVTGAVALLKEAFPNLTGKQIKLALYFTAQDLGTNGEDNNYGMGIIDVLAAFLYLSEPDSLAPTGISDLAVNNVTSNSISLQWTVPIDSSVTGIAQYDIRYAASPIADSADFANAFSAPFLGKPDTSGAVETFTISGLDFTTHYYFAIKASDVWGNLSAISNVVDTLTLAAPVVVVTPNSIFRYMRNGFEVTDTILIENISVDPSTLDYSITLQNDTYPDSLFSFRVFPIQSEVNNVFESKDAVNTTENLGQTINGSGGPDNFGYKYKDSDEPGGPQFVWQDITADGTRINQWSGSLDDGYSAAVPIGFSFNYYGVEKTNVYVSTNGFLSFNQLTNAYYSNAGIPTGALPNNLVAAFWDDLSGSDGGTVHYKQEPGRFILQFTDWPAYSGGGVQTFQIVLDQSGKIVYYYNTVSGDLNSCTIGIEDAAGSDGLQVAFNSAYLKDSLAVQFAANPDWFLIAGAEGTLASGNSVGIEYTMVTEDFPLGHYSWDFVVESNDPEDSVITLPVELVLIDSIIAAPQNLLPPNDTTKAELTQKLKWTDVDFSEFYSVEFGTDSLQTVVLALDKETGNELQVDSLEESTVYFWHVNAYNSSDTSDYSEMWNFTTKLNAPDSLAAEARGLGLIRLNWNDNSQKELGYIIERQLPNSLLFMVVDTVESNVTEFEESGLSDSTAYFYKVRAYDSLQFSSYSNTAEVLTPVGTKDENVLPKEFALYQNYPNPFNPSTVIKYALPVNAQVRIQIYNMLGEVVATLVDGVRNAGYHEIAWNMTQNASGVYFYRIDAKEIGGKKEFRNVMKMVYVK